jgi:uncharacterized membrane protein YfcA
MSEPSLFSWMVLLAAAALGGAANALAGGGTFLTFPVLLWAGAPPVVSNATSTFVLTPGGYASTWVYRDRLVHGWGFQIAMAAAAMAGALVGSQLLLHASEQSFERLVPYLMLAATLIFTFSGWLRVAAAAHAAETMHLATLLAGQFGIAVYGGYFGAGMGVLMLVLYTVAASMDVHEASGLRILCGALTNTVAIVVFAVRGVIVWRLGLPMMLACIAGGYWGAKIVKRLEAEKARKTILVYAWAITAWLFVRPIHRF